MRWVQFPRDGRYAISDTGLVKYVKSGRIRKLYRGANGYMVFSCTDPKIKNKRHTYYVHSAVAECFIGPRLPGMTVSHLDGSRDMNCVDNLIYESLKENHARKAAHGTLNIGERNGSAKLSKEQINAIRRSHLPLKDLSIKHGVSISQVSRVRLGQNWTHL